MRLAIDTINDEIFSCKLKNGVSMVRYIRPYYKNNFRARVDFDIYSSPFSSSIVDVGLLFEGLCKDSESSASMDYLLTLEKKYPIRTTLNYEDCKVGVSGGYWLSEPDGIRYITYFDFSKSTSFSLDVSSLISSLAY